MTQLKRRPDLQQLERLVGKDAYEIVMSLPEGEREWFLKAAHLIVPTKSGEKQLSKASRLGLEILSRSFCFGGNWMEMAASLSARLRRTLAADHPASVPDHANGFGGACRGD